MENSLLEIINALSSKKDFSSIRKKLLNKNIKILVTGDLNSGKSTLVNSIYKKEIVPMDNEPCTSSFISISSDNSDSSDKIICNSRQEILNVFKLEKKIQVFQDSFNSNMEIIDSPGLNIDLITSIKVIKEKEEIDLILYVLTGENHLTLTGKEFLQEIRNDTRVVVIVNRMDLIKDKIKCKKEIMKQLQDLKFKELSVFFISAKQVLQGLNTDVELNQDFVNMENSLKEFVERKRIVKLTNAKMYLENYLKDEEENTLKKAGELKIILENTEQEMANVKRENVKMALMKMSFEDVDSRIEVVAKGVCNFTKTNIKEMLQDLELLFEAVEWEGPLFAWYYAQRLCLLSSKLSHSRIIHCLLYAQEACLKCIEPIYLTSGHLIPELSLQVDKVEIEECLGMDLEIPKIKLTYYDILAVEQVQAVFLPVLGVCTAGMYALKDNLLKSLTVFPVYSGILRNAKAVVITSSIAGVGAFLFLALNDVKGRLQKRIKEKISLEYSKSKFIDDTAENIAMKTRKVLRTCLWNLQSPYSILYSQNASLLESLKKKHTQAQKDFDACQEFLAKISELQDKLDQVQEQP